DADSGIVELLTRRLYLLQGNCKSPFPQLLPRHLGLHMRRKHFAVAQFARHHRLDNSVQRLFAEAVGLRPELDPAIVELIREAAFSAPGTQTIGTPASAILPKSRREYMPKAPVADKNPIMLDPWPLAHSARTDGGKDFVRAEFVAWLEGHEYEQVYRTGSGNGANY